MNFTLILSQSVSKFDMGNCVLFYDVFMKWEGPQQLLKVWFCKLKVFMWILTCMLYVSIVVTYIFTVNESSITKTNFTFSCKIKKKVIFPTVYVVDFFHLSLFYFYLVVF